MAMFDEPAVKTEENPSQGFDAPNFQGTVGDQPNVEPPQVDLPPQDSTPPAEQNGSHADPVQNAPSTESAPTAEDTTSSEALVDDSEDDVEAEGSQIEVDPSNYAGNSGMDWAQVASLVRFSLDYVKLPEGHREILRTLAAPAPSRGRGRKKVQLPDDEPIAVAQALMSGNILVDGYWFIGEVMGALREGSTPTFEQGMQWVLTVQNSAPEFLSAMFTYLNAVAKQFPTGEPQAEAYKANTSPSEVVHQVRIAAASIDKEGHEIIETMQSILAIWPGH